MLFDWSSLPCGIKRIIFKFNRLEYKKHLELIQFRKLMLYEEIQKNKKSKIKIKYKYGKCYFNNLPLGKNINFHQLKTNLDNLCYICNKNCIEDIYPVRFSWENTKLNKVVTNTLYICLQCDDITGLQNSGIINQTHWKNCKETFYKGRLLLDVIRTNFSII